ncbi:Mannan endo-1,6-alpha-mannosidase DCW1 [Yarrowia sp. B02]|nr:Mannan endo-1,6-alpha-mannosidase DCW1 [Yarrowia sp. B02]
MRFGLIPALLSALVFLLGTVRADLSFMDLDKPDTVHEALSLVAGGLMDYYDGTRPGGTVGMFVAPYYWWHAGAAWNAFIDYWHITGNDTYNNLTWAAMKHQRGEKYDLMVSNFSSSEGNDDQGVWAMTMMTAAEKNFPEPGDEYGWLYVAQGAFNTMAARWDTQSCYGGLHWQIFQWNSGYDYKNAIANGALFNLGARLYRYTGNITYLEWAERIWDWSTQIQIVDNGRVYDGIHLPNCSDRSPYLWTYNAGIYLSGAAALYNATVLRNNTDPRHGLWFDRANTLWNATKGPNLFFGGPDKNIMVEIACQQKTITCNSDQRTFKGIFSSLLGQTAQMVPTLASDIMWYLRASAMAAARTCSGGRDGHTCSLNWLTGQYSNDYIGLGEQLSAMEVIQNTQVLLSSGPLTDITGGTSKGNGSAGAMGFHPFGADEAHPLNIGGGDRAGAAIITVIVGIMMIAAGWWLLV